MAKAKTQIEKFRETARAIGADESEDRFSAALKVIARHKPSPQAKRPSAKVPGKRKKR